MNHTTTSSASTRYLVLTALMTAIICILAPLSIPIPVSPVPISLTNLVLYIGLFILPWRQRSLSYIVSVSYTHLKADSLRYHSHCLIPSSR